MTVVFLNFSDGVRTRVDQCAFPAGPYTLSSPLTLDAYGPRAGLFSYGLPTKWRLGPAVRVIWYKIRPSKFTFKTYKNLSIKCDTLTKKLKPEYVSLVWPRGHIIRKMNMIVLILSFWKLREFKNTIRANWGLTVVSKPKLSFYLHCS